MNFCSSFLPRRMRVITSFSHTELRQPLCHALCSVRMSHLLSFIFSKYSFIRISREETKRPYSSSVICSMSGLPTTKTLMPRGFLLTSISSTHITSFQIKVVSVSPCLLRLFQPRKAFVCHAASLLFDIFSRRYSKSFLFFMRTYSQE